MEEKQQVEEKKEEKQEIPKGYYLAQVPTGYGTVVAKGKEQISVEELIVKMANALEEAGLLKDKE